VHRKKRGRRKTKENEISIQSLVGGGPHFSTRGILPSVEEEEKNHGFTIERGRGKVIRHINPEGGVQ